MVKYSGVPFTLIGFGLIVYSVGWTAAIGVFMALLGGNIARNLSK